MVYRIYVEKKPGLAHEATALLKELQGNLGITRLKGLRLLNRYDVEGMGRELFETCVPLVFSEPQLDEVSEALPTGDAVFAVEYLPGQFDQRADSAAQCVQLLTQGERPTVRTAKVYVLKGDLTAEDLAAVKGYVINPVEAREASLETVKTLQTDYAIPTAVAVEAGFTSLDEVGLAAMLKELGLAMDLDDLKFCQRYFQQEGRDPTITEIRMIDTYWSDHCRHTTFLTTLDAVTFEDPEIEAAFQRYLKGREALGRTKPVNLMDMGTLAAKLLKKAGKLQKLDESEEINACTVKITVEVDGKAEPWLLLFKNETHNHPTEIEPFGGAATCIGGAIRDPLSGRSYVYAAMRLTGAADPRVPLSETLPGKLPQRKICTTAAAGYSSYGNQIGLATGLVDELYHPGYAAKRMEIGAVIAAAPAENVRRACPAPGDSVILLGGRTGRDGCGGATGSSKSHTVESIHTCGAEVQKGNAPEERKLQRLFRNPAAARLIKRCNDFGAGGVSVAIGELADGLDIDLSQVPRKYDGLDGTELAISESQERMAVVVAPEDAERFLALAAAENLEAVVVARVKADPRLTMTWNGKTIVDISREFLNSNGAEKHMTVSVAAPNRSPAAAPASFAGGMEALAGDLRFCSRRGLSERFDSTIGAGTVLMPFGGRNQRTPIQAMVHKISLEKGHTDDCSLMAWGYDPVLSEQSPYHGAYTAVVESVSKLIAAGASFDDVYLTFQEYFEKPGRDPKRWGKPTAALLGAFAAQMDLGVAAIGGKDSMSGSFEDLDVPPTLVSFAVTTGKTGEILSGEFKAAGHAVRLLRPAYGPQGLPDPESLRAVYRRVKALMDGGKVAAAYTLTAGGVAEAVFKMALGNGLGFAYDDSLALADLFRPQPGAFLLEITGDDRPGEAVGIVTAEPALRFGGEQVALAALLARYEETLEPVYPTRAAARRDMPPVFSAPAAPRLAPHILCPRPQVLIPVFPGTNCEYDTARAMEDAGAKAEIYVIRNLSAAAIARSVEEFSRRIDDSQIIFLPGGFSGGDEPDGSGKFITAFFRGQAVAEAVARLLEQRDGLMAGICNGFQALIKLGLVPYGKIMPPDANAPTLTYNAIGRHQSRLVRTRIASNRSPWLSKTQVGEIYTVPISHGEGRFLAGDAVVAALSQNGQIATQYVDLEGRPTYDIDFNPNGSVAAIEGITSPDGRVLGKMGHSERIGKGLYKNVPGRFEMGMFQSAVEYFQ